MFPVAFVEENSKTPSNIVGDLAHSGSVESVPSAIEAARIESIEDLELMAARGRGHDVQLGIISCAIQANVRLFIIKPPLRPSNHKPNRFAASHWVAPFYPLVERSIEYSRPA